jgi:hypothetical protein
VHRGQGRGAEVDGGTRRRDSLLICLVCFAKVTR